ncbi:SGNH/GDSL hydrolase family protein [Microbacterium sp. ZW T5_45]|uniref:SGNH/GDSL hydrolase family protein n=1 Tax=Microbacterium sp. ZW T5_45 TaxID=3378080 RepID=UPI00385438D6
MIHAASRRRRRRAGLAIGLVVTLAAVVLGVWRPWSSAPSAAPVVAAGTTVTIDPSPLVLPEHPTVLVFGDSWTYGSAANVPTEGYAYVLADLLDGTTIVNGVRGSGYLKPGLDGPAFGERIAALDPTLSPDLVILQGSINDREQGEAGYRDAVNAAWDRMAATFPDAQILILGPAPHELPAAAGTVRIDHDLAQLAGARGWWYISPLAEDWITEANYLDVIDVEVGRRHPSTAGHRYLAERLAADLADLAAAPVTEAGASSETSEQ